MSAAVKARTWALTALIVLLTAVIGWATVNAVTGRSITNRDLLVELRTQSCILSLALEDRTEEARELCRVQAETLTP